MMSSLRASCIPLPTYPYSAFFSTSLSFSPPLPRLSVLPTISRENPRANLVPPLYTKFTYSLSPSPTSLSLSLSLIFFHPPTARTRHLIQSHRHHQILFDRKILRDNAHLLLRIFCPFSTQTKDRFSFNQEVQLPLCDFPYCAQKSMTGRDGNKKKEILIRI